MSSTSWRVTTYDSESSDDIIYETPPRRLQKPRKKRTQMAIKVAHCFEDSFIDPREDFKGVKIESTRYGSQNRPYVYRAIDEVLEFSDTCFPKINSSHIVAVFKFCENFGQCLVNNSFDSKFIQVDMKLVNNMPGDGDFISAFGSIEFREGCMNNLIFLVRFYRPEAGALVNDYKKNLMLIRCFVPTCYSSTVSLRSQSEDTFIES